MSGKTITINKFGLKEYSDYGYAQYSERLIYEGYCPGSFTVTGNANSAKQIRIKINGTTKATGANPTVTANDATVSIYVYYAANNEGGYSISASIRFS